MVSSWQPAIGSALGERFSLTEIMGVGPTGIVYGAEASNGLGPVVVKCFHPGLFTGSSRDTNVERLQRALQFAHPAMATIHEVALDGPVPYVATERLESPDLVTWSSERGRLTIEAAFEVMECLVEPLHALGLVGTHGNLRPSNIFMDPSGDARLTDPWFLEGLAELPEADLPCREMAWLAPEQMGGRWSERPETDVYAFALLLGYLLGGFPVMGGRSLIQQRVIVPEVVDEVFKRATQMRPGERYGSILDVWATMELAWRSTQEDSEFDDDVDGTTTGLDAGPGWSPATVGETQQVPPPSSLAALRESQESDAQTFRSLEAQLLESAELDQGEDPGGGAPAAPGAVGDIALEGDEQGAEPAREEGARETSVIPRDSTVIGDEMQDHPEGEAPREQAASGTSDDSVTSTINVRVGTTVAQPSGRDGALSAEGPASLKRALGAIVPPTLPGDAMDNGVAVVFGDEDAVDSELPEDQLALTIRQVPGPGTARALEAAIQAQVLHRSEEVTRTAATALEATLQGDLRTRVPITILGPVMFLLALVFALVVLSDLQGEPDLTRGTTPVPPATTPVPAATGSEEAPPAAAAAPGGTETPRPSSSSQKLSPAPVEPEVVVETPPPTMDPEAFDCPQDMARVWRKARGPRGDGTTGDVLGVWCVERYEYPGKNEVPRVGVTLAEAAMLCEARDGRRLCTREEWRWGCGGRYPYGRAYHASTCGTVAADRKPRAAVAAGAYPRCMSSWGLYDMVGNVAEWTAGGLVQGGSASRDGERATCNYAVSETTARLDVGFRCCQVATGPGENNR